MRTSFQQLLSKKTLWFSLKFSFKTYLSNLPHDSLLPPMIWVFLTDCCWCFYWSQTYWLNSQVSAEWHSLTAISRATLISLCWGWGLLYWRKKKKVLFEKRPSYKTDVHLLIVYCDSWSFPHEQQHLCLIWAWLIDTLAKTDNASLYFLFSGCVILSKWYSCDDWVYDADYSRLDP